MVLRINREMLTTTLQPYPALRRALRDDWLDKNFHEPPWRFGTHPLMPWLWTPSVDVFLGNLDAAVDHFVRNNIAGHAAILADLRSVAKFRTVLPQLFIGHYLMRSGFDVTFPKSRHEKLPDVRICRGSDALDIEVRTFVQTMGVQALRVMMSAMMVGEPLTVSLSIPDSQQLTRVEIERVERAIHRRLCRNPFRSGRRTEPVHIRVARTRHTLRLVPREAGPGWSNMTFFGSLTDAQKNRAIKTVRGRLTEKADQLPNGGVVLLSIESIDETMAGFFRHYARDADIQREMWDSVPEKVFGMFTYHLDVETGEPRELQYYANPYTTAEPPDLLHELLAGPLKERDHPAPKGDWIDQLAAEVSAF